jgi:uncharacterized protein
MVSIESVQADVIPMMVRRIVEEFHPLKIILFGSYARGDAGRNSDVDLLVILPEVSSRRAVTVAIRDILADFPVCKDVIVSTPSEVAMRGQAAGSVLRPALREGKVLYEAG